MVISLLEVKFGLRKYLFKSKHHMEDVFWLLVNHLIYPFLTAFLSFNVGKTVSILLADFHHFFNFTDKHYLIQFTCLILSTDLISYWLHRAFHSLTPLWDIHRLHHSSTELTVLSSFRVSWLEIFTFSIFLGFASGIFLVDERVRLLTSFSFSLVCYIQHANLKLKYPAFFEKVFITPKNHYWHHSKELHTKNGQNFGFLFPWWDMLFKTHYNPNHVNTTIGLSDDFQYKGLAHKFFYPISKWLRLD